MAADDGIERLNNRSTIVGSTIENRDFQVHERPIDHRPLDNQATGEFGAV
jgi:hypothetical protein